MSCLEVLVMCLDHRFPQFDSSIQHSVRSDTQEDRGKEPSYFFVSKFIPFKSYFVYNYFRIAQLLHYL